MSFLRRTAVPPLVAVLCLTGFSNAQRDTAGKQKPFSIEISIAKPTIAAGSPVYIKVVMTNTSNQNVDCSSYYVNGSDLRFRVKVQSQDGKSMKRQDAHPELLPGSLQACTLAPGESTLPKEILITAFHDLSQPGTYQIHVDRAVSNTEREGAVSSNDISISVEP